MSFNSIFLPQKSRNTWWSYKDKLKQTKLRKFRFSVNSPMNRIHIGLHTSQFWREQTNEVLQGSILSPLLFLRTIDDIRLVKAVGRFVVRYTFFWKFVISQRILSCHVWRKIAKEHKDLKRSSFETQIYIKYWENNGRKL